MLYISWITEQIAVGRSFLDQDLPYIKNSGIDVIVDMRSEYCDNKELIEKFSIQFINIPVDDRYAPSFNQLKSLFGFVAPLLDSGKKILVHCQNSCGRSPLAVIAILAKRGMEIPDAVKLVEDKHPIVGFTPQQERFIYVELDKFLKLE